MDGSFVLLDLFDQLSLVHLLERLHYFLALGYLLNCVLLVCLWGCVVIGYWRMADVEGGHHVFSSDVAHNHFEGKTFRV